MSEHDPMLALGGLIDEPVAPRHAFAEALRAQLIAELASDERTAEKERKMTNLAAPAVIVRFPERAKRTRRQRLMKVFEIAAVAAIAIGLIAALSSGRWDRADSPTPASNSIQVMAPIGTPSPVASPNAATGLLWRVDPPEDSKDLFRIAAANGTLYRVMSDAYGSPIVSAIDSATGIVRWSKVVDSASGGIAADDNGVYLTDGWGNDGGSVVALDPATGEQRWSAEAGFSIVAPMIDNTRIYVWNEANELVAIDSLTGEIAWKRPLSVGDPITTSSKGVRLFQGPAALEGATIAVGALDGTIAAIHVSGAPGGEALWSRTYSREISFGFGITGDVIATVLSSSNIDLPASALEAVDRANGATIWRHELGIAGTLLTTKDAFIIAHSASSSTPSSGTEDFILSAYDPATGDERWSLSGITPLQVSSDGMIVFGTTTDEHFLVAISASDGQVLGSLALDKAFYGPAVADEQAVYGRDWSNATVAYSIEALLNGRIPNEAPSSVATPDHASGVNWVSSPTNQSPTRLEYINDGAIAADSGMVFRYVRVEGFDTVEALDATTGTGLWKTPVAPAHADGLTSGLGFVAAENGYVFAVAGFLPNTTAKLFALDQATGEIIWIAEVGEAPGIPMIGQDQVYVWSDHSTLFAFDISTGALKWQHTETGASMDGYAPRIDEGSQRVIYTPSLLVDQNVYVSTENGSLAVIGVSNLSKGTTNGSFFYEGGYAQSIAVSGDVIAFVIASTSNETAQVVALNRWNPGANPLWEKSFERGVGKLIPIEGGFLITHGTGKVPSTPTSAETVDFVTTAYDASTGQERWNLQQVAPSTATNEGQIVIGMNEQGQLFAIRAKDGQILGMLDLDIPGTTFATTDGTRVYVPTNDATIYAVRLYALLNGRTPEMATPTADAMRGAEGLR